MEYRCKICAGSLSVDSKTRIAVCDYCGTKQTLPLFCDDSSKALYERGNQYLLHNEYDKAEAVFAQLLSVNPNDAEIYWDLVLCKYGVTYAKDPASGKYIPTCNRTRTESVLKDTDYLKALELSQGEKAELYKNDAEMIDNIQKGILLLSRKEKPFDIFISFKDTDSNGIRTKDSIAAQKLYEKLTALGYKVFFSRITLETKIGEEYEPYIYAALSSSKVMVTVCSSAENINSAWVKNEWSRFLTLRRNDVTKTLIPVFFDMNETDLPEEFSLLSALNMHTEDFEQELFRGIKKLIPTPIELKIKHKKTTRILMLTMTFLILIGSFIAWITYYQISKKNIVSEKQQEKEPSLYLEKDITSGNIDYDETTDFEVPSDSAQEKAYQEDYDKAMNLYYEHRYAEATWALKEIDTYDDVVMQSLEMSKKAWRESLSAVAFIELNLSGATRGSYYINVNGKVDTFTSDPGEYNVEYIVNSSGTQIGENPLATNSHGKVVSIGANYPLYALYEDGFVCNSAYSNRMASDWDNIIQISDNFITTNVALTDEGKVIFGDLSDDINGENDKWLQNVSTWNNIIKIDWDGTDNRYGYGGLYNGAVIIGMDSSGKIYDVVYARPDENGNTTYYDNYYSALRNAVNYINNIPELKDVKIANGYLGALNKDNVLYVINYNDNLTYEIPNVCDFWGEYYVDTKNNLKTIGSDRVILSGVIYVNDNYCVSQSGNIYKCDGSGTDGKTSVKDVWLER